MFYVKSHDLKSPKIKIPILHVCILIGKHQIHTFYILVSHFKKQIKLSVADRSSDPHLLLHKMSRRKNYKIVLLFIDLDGKVYFFRFQNFKRQYLSQGFFRGYVNGNWLVKF